MYRRTLLGAVAAVPLIGTPVIKLRLLETSDLHMFALDWDYYQDKPDPTVGLAKTATLIAQARAEARNSMLFDNGDIIQGAPLGDWVHEKAPPGHTHPMFAAMNMLGYDAATVGNHEFNFGLPFLDRAIRDARFPFVCANLLHVDGSDVLPPAIVLERAMVADDGSRHTLRVGVIGFVPPQIMTWDRGHLEGRVTAHDIVSMAEKHVPGLRARCDVLVALCHSGIGTGPRRTGLEDASFHLAQVPGIDAIFTGHSHQVFPGPRYANLPGVDAVRGTLSGVPAVMPGFWGSHLGLIDLVLAGGPGGWRVTDFAVEARPIYRREGTQVVSLAAPAPTIVQAVAADHAATIAWTAQPVGVFSAPVNSFFSMVKPDACVAITNAAQLWYARPLLVNTPHAGLPLLAAAAPFRAGGTGAEAFIDIPAGPVNLRNIADLYVFANTVAVVRITGAQVRGWLERSAAAFRQVDPAVRTPQDVVDLRVPSYAFDILSGVEYAIDVTRPLGSRIVELHYGGQPVADGQEFCVVTNNYRADGGGRYPGLDGSTTILRAPDLSRDAIVRWVESQGTVDTRVPAGGWAFAAVAPMVLAWRTSVRARTYLPEMTDVVDLGDTAEGYARFGVRIG